MERLTVYLGSDHVIQQPGFGLLQNTLRVTTCPEDAIRQACRNREAGILNAYQLDLDLLSVKAPCQQILEGFEHFDVEVSADPEDAHIWLCSENALRSLTFVNASFVNQ